MDMFSLAQAVAGYLGSEWEAERHETEGFASIHKPGSFRGQLRVTMRHDRKSDKLVCSGGKAMAKDGWVYPYGETEPSISVGATRAAKDVAGEIRRRLLPEYQQWFAKGVLSIAPHESLIDAQQDALASAADILDIDAPPLGADRIQDGPAWPDRERRGTVREIYASRDYMNLRLDHIPTGVALRLLAAWKDWTA